MPTHNELALFQREFAKLTPAQKRQFAKALQKLVNDLRAGVEFRPSLRIKRVQGHEGIFEMTWADDGRATFEYGPAILPGETHIIWRRIGTRDILKEP